MCSYRRHETKKEMVRIVKTKENEIFIDDTEEKWSALMFQWMKQSFNKQRKRYLSGV